MDARVLSFLLLAKKSTYAAHGAEALSSRPNSHDLTFAAGDLQYIDTYLGGTHFAGEEAVWQDGKPVWSMNYCGRVFGEGFRGDFLKSALLRVPENAPYRGPDVYREGDMEYHCQADGNIDWFQGYEEIRLHDVRIYECFYHGSLIQ